MKVSQSYVAGLLDAAGCLSVVGGSIRIYMALSTRKVLDELAEAFGGSVTQRQSSAGQRPLFAWVIYGRAAEHVLRQICQYLQPRFVQAALLIEYQNLDRGDPRRAEIKAELSRLKRPVYLADGTVKFGPVGQ